MQETTDNVVTLEMQHSIVGYSKTQIMLETTRTREFNIGWNFVHIWKTYIVPTCWICEKQTSISLSTTESEIIRLMLDCECVDICILNLVHTSHCGSRCRTTCLHETRSSTCHLMSERLLFLCFVFFHCLSCLYFFSSTCSLS